MIQGSVLENIMMGLFNLDFAMKDYEETLKNGKCSEVVFENIPDWKDVHQSITHESMAVISDKIRIHFNDAVAASHEMKQAWLV